MNPSPGILALLAGILAGASHHGTEVAALEAVYCPTDWVVRVLADWDALLRKSPLVVTSLTSLCLKRIFSVCSIRGLGAL